MILAVNKNELRIYDFPIIPIDFNGNFFVGKIHLILSQLSFVPYRINIYIGSDNSSKRIDQRYLERVKNWANTVFPDGYTILKGKGYYRGTSEDSLILHVLLDYEINLENHLSKLKEELGQEAILVVKSKVDAKVI